MGDESGGRVAPSRYVLFLAIVLAGAGFDLAAKSYIFEHVGPPGASRVVVADILELRTSHNEGALWGFGRGFKYSALIFAALSLVASVAICWWLFVKGAARDVRYTLALGLIMAGALGNCYDRLRFGYVRDFVYFHVDAIHFSCAIFNFADNMLILGAIGLMLLALRPETSAEAEAVAATPDQIQL